MNLTLVGTSRCDVPAREAAGGIIAPLSAARTAQRAVPTRFRVQMRGCKTVETFHEPTHPSPLPGGELGKRTPTLNPLLGGVGGGVHGPNSRPIFGAARFP